MSKLLLLACSQRKRLTAELLPAVERYDGPMFRLLRRYSRQDSAAYPDVKILSAEYGLISASYLIPHYDRRITKERAHQLNSQVLAKIEHAFNEKYYTNLLICMGRNYLEAIYGYECIIPSRTTVQYAEGGIGRKLSILHDWLYGDLSNFHSEKLAVASTGKACIRGIEVNLTPDQILDIAREAITKHENGSGGFYSWYVSIDDQRVAPKWLVGQITGLPVSNFVTDDARRVLTQLGVEVKRV